MHARPLPLPAVEAAKPQGFVPVGSVAAVERGGQAGEGGGLGAPNNIKNNL